MKFILPKKPCASKLFMPRFDFKTMDINGTQLMMCKNHETSCAIPRQEAFRFQNECLLSNYFNIFEKNELQCVLIEVQLTCTMIESLEHDKKFMLLQNAIRTIFSSVPFDKTTEQLTPDVKHTKVME
jgi:hypothetical protein